jgi:hypothetical protein
MSERMATAIGVLLGIAISGYFLVYRPMHRNYTECGRVTLCRPDDGEVKS